MTVQLGIIGAGTIGRYHVDAANALGIPVGHVVDIDSGRGQELASLCQARYAADPRDLYRDQQVTAVVVGVPNSLHRDVAIAALESGKDVLLEKPMAMNLAECREINQLAARLGRIVQLGFVHRYTAVGQAAKSVVESGQLGNIYHARAHLNLRRSVPGLGKWFTTRALAGGGAIMDVGVHLLDLVLFLLDHPQPSSVSAQVHQNFGVHIREYVYENMWAGPPQREGICDVDDAGHALIRFPGDVTLDLQIAWAGNFPHGAFPESQVALLGTRGGLSFELFGDHLLLAREEFGRLTDTRVRLSAVLPYQAQLCDFAAAVESRQVQGATGDEGAQVQAIVDSIYQSSRQRSEVHGNESL